MILALFEDAGFIVGSYAITGVAIAALAWRLVTAGRRLGKQIPDDDKYWT